MFYKKCLRRALGVSVVMVLNRDKIKMRKHQEPVGVSGSEDSEVFGQVERMDKEMLTKRIEEFRWIDRPIRSRGA